VRRDPDVAPGVEERLERAHEVGPHGLEVPELDLLGLDVDALAEPDARPQVGQRGDVCDRASQRRLQDDAQVVVAQVVGELEPEGGRLDAHVRVEALALDRREHVLVRVRDRARLVRAPDLLAEDVDRGQLAFGVQPLHDVAGVHELRPRDVPL
jgi:hypothetical protein